MRIRSVRYYLNEAFIGMFRNRLMSLASMVTVASCMLIVTLSYCVAVNLDETLVRVEGLVGLVAYIADDYPDADVSALYNKVKAIDGVKSVAYVSAQDALESFSASLGGDSSVMSGFEKNNPMPRSFNIEVTDANKQTSVVTSLTGMSGISEVRHQQNVVDALVAVNRGVRVVSLIIIAVLLVISVVIIMNTIRLTVTNRKLEINIMKYVGATDKFIRWPFVIEGILIGLIGSAVPVLLCWVSYPQVTSALNRRLPAMLDGLISFIPAHAVFEGLFPVTLVLGAAVGAVGSITSVRKHLHV